MKQIFLFTNSYPYGEVTETFLSAEIEVASIIKVDLTIIPLKSENYRRSLPANIKLNTNLAETSRARRFMVFLVMMFNPLFWKIPFQDKYSPQSLKQYFYAIKYLYGSFLIKDFIEINKMVFSNNALIYSYWFNHTSLGAVLAKLDNPFHLDFKIISRAHGFDVYENKVGMYFPYRKPTLKHIDQVYTVSNKGKLYLNLKYPEFNNKISVSRLGTLPIEHHRIDNQADTLSFLSCSSIIPVKRVELIYSSILNYAFENKDKFIKWIHIGAGSGFIELQNLVKGNTLSNFNIELMGFIENTAVRNILSKEKFDIFINLSLSEGVPVSIMEAISVGIPILATSVGGNNEIVTPETGLLLSEDFTQSHFNAAVNQIVNSKKFLIESAYIFYKANFDAKTNYSEFYNVIVNV